MRVQWVATYSPMVHQEVERTVDWHETVSDVARWALAMRSPHVIETVIPQDEFTRDVVVRFATGLYLVYDASRLGSVRSVSVWSHVPSASELLEFRVASGWRPTPTATRSGPRVLGYAAQYAGHAA